MICECGHPIGNYPGGKLMHIRGKPGEESEFSITCWRCKCKSAEASESASAPEHALCAGKEPQVRLTTDAAPEKLEETRKMLENEYKPISKRRELVKKGGKR